VKLNTVFLNVSRPDTYGELPTWIWLSIVPFRRCDVWCHTSFNPPVLRHTSSQ